MEDNMLARVDIPTRTLHFPSDHRVLDRADHWKYSGICLDKLIVDDVSIMTYHQLCFMTARLRSNECIPELWVEGTKYDSVSDTKELTFNIEKQTNER